MWFSFLFLLIFIVAFVHRCVSNSFCLFERITALVFTFHDVFDFAVLLRTKFSFHLLAVPTETVSRTELGAIVVSCLRTI
jgi:hypothetical protein